MERGIKFRGKRVDKEEFAFGDLLTGMGYKKGKFFILPHLSYYPSDCKSVDGYEVIPETIGQYTGLKDKNGKEIYEGDIIRSFDSNDDAILHYIFWEEARFVALYKDRHFSSKCFLMQDWLDEFDKEVIGNIHDNPELLKDGRD